MREQQRINGIAQEQYLQEYCHEYEFLVTK